MSIITAIFVLLMLSGIAAYVLSISTVQHSTSAADVLGARALLAARSGVEWGAYQVLQNAAGGYCAGASDSQTVNGLSGALSGFSATVDCTHTQHAEASTVNNVHVFRLVATACNQPPCPSATPGANYIERQMTAVVSR
jgi:MSHA biogenesis protein MshP